MEQQNTSIMHNDLFLLVSKQLSDNLIKIGDYDDGYRQYTVLKECTTEQLWWLNKRINLFGVTFKILYCTDILGIQDNNGMFIGVEKDGYAHT